MERNRTTEAHSRSRDGRGRDKSGHRKKPTERGVLTNWRRQREDLVRTQKETDRSRHTHILETAEGEIVRIQKETDQAMRAHSLETAKGETCQDTEGSQPSEAHLLPGDDGGRDFSGHRAKRTDRGTLTSWRRQRERLSGHRKKRTKQCALTPWRQQRERIFRIRKETNRARDMGTHKLENADGGPSQYIETMCGSSKSVVIETSA